MVNGFFPHSLQEALEILSQHSAVPYGGGTDLMVQNKPCEAYLFLRKIPEMTQIKVDDEYIRIGAAVTFTEALADARVPQLMKEAVSRIAAPAIRNAGTFGGNLGNGSAKADSVLIEFVSDAKLLIKSLNKERLVEVDKFYLGRKKLDLAADELIVEVLLPKNGWDKFYYQKVGGRNALAISRVSFAGLFAIEDGRITNIASAFGAVADTVLRYKDLENMLLGKTLAEAKELKEEFLKAYNERMVLTRGRVSAEYRKTVCMNLLRDFLTQYGI